MEWAKYVAFIESSSAGEWWSERSLRDVNFVDDMNLFSVAKNYPAIKLRCTVKAVKDWVTRPSVPAIDKPKSTWSNLEDGAFMTNILQQNFF